MKKYTCPSKVLILVLFSVWQSELNFFRQYKQPNIIVQLYSISGPED